jgi:excisionase family DNA binding protein
VKEGDVSDHPDAGKSSSGNLLSLHDVAAELGVHYMTVYRYVRLGQLPATKSGSTWTVRPDDLAAFRNNDAPVSTEADRRVDWSDRYEARLVAGDRAGAWSVIEACLVAGRSAADVYLEVIGPALKRIGERWASGEIDVAGEHRATVIARHHVGRLSPRFGRRGRSRGTVLLGCVPGERHDVGLSMVADLLRGVGFEAIDLGADVPEASFVVAAREAERLVAVGLSLHHPDLLDAAGRVVAALREALPNVLVMVGGSGVGEADRDAVGADVVVSEALDAVGWLDAQRS